MNNYIDVVDWTKQEGLHSNANMLAILHREESGKKILVFMSELPVMVYVLLVALYASWAALPSLWWPYPALNRVPWYSEHESPKYHGTLTRVPSFDQSTSQLPKEI